MARKYLLRNAAMALTVIMVTGAIGATIDRYDDFKKTEQAVVDILAIEAQERKALQDWHESMMKIQAETKEYEAALEAALLVRRATGDFGEVYDAVIE